MPTETKVCETCGGNFTRTSSPANLKRQRFCSLKCFGGKIRESMPTFEEAMKERLYERSKPMPNGCRIYTGQKALVYGQIEFKRRTYLVHRVAWQLENGKIPRKMCICHKCDTPLCINVDHLFLGTYKDNVRDMMAKGRGKMGIYARRPCAKAK